MESKPIVTCDWDGVAWIWNYDQKRWLVDCERSGGPPSITEQAKNQPPVKVSEK